MQTPKATTNLLQNSRRMKLAAFAGSQKQQEDITRLGTSALALPATSGLSWLQMGNNIVVYYTISAFFKY